jgi:hypothetical protein
MQALTAVDVLDSHRVVGKALLIDDCFLSWFGDIPKQIKADLQSQKIQQL